jgi:hypothetical protein
LLHAFGENHTNDAYAFMNYNDFPWAGGGRTEAEAIRPLPDDVSFLRNKYPGAGPARSEVAVLNTWFTATSIVDANGNPVATPQHLNCAPSLGTSDTDYYAPHCGVGGADAGSTEICPNDVLRTHFTVANYSNKHVDLTARMYLSLDDRYTNLDAVSVTSRPISLDAAVSGHYAKTWRVPNPATTDTTYSVLIRVTGTTIAGDSVEDWLPLTGTVHIKAANLC